MEKVYKLTIYYFSMVKSEKLSYQESVDDALTRFRLLPLHSIIKDDDLILKERVQETDNMHIRTDYIIHPRSAIRKTDDGRFSVKSDMVERLDDLNNLYFNPRFGKRFFGSTPERYLTQDGWELFILNNQEMLEVNSKAYKQCDHCHETMPLYSKNQTGKEGSIRPGIWYVNPAVHVRETREFKLKTPLQILLKDTGMVITKIDHPCYHSLQDLIRPEETNSNSVDPPTIEPVFPKDISY